jgi:hypothetical protein
MDNSNGYTSSILQPSDGSSGLASSNSISGSSENTGILDMLRNISLTTWLIIILILAFLGVNIFIYLAKGTQNITNIFGPLIKTIVGLFTVITGDVVDVTAEGTKTVVNATAGTIDKGLTAVQDITPNTPNSNFKTQPVQQQQPDLMANNTLNKALNTSQNTQSSSTDYQADESTSNIQGGTSKSGWCYIGEDRGFRSCAQIGENDKCMSGDIFPTQEICVNPNLRS